MCRGSISDQWFSDWVQNWQSWGYRDAALNETFNFWGNDDGKL